MLFNRALRAFDRLPVPTKITQSQHRSPLPLLQRSFHQSEIILQGSRSGEGMSDVDEHRNTGKIGVLKFHPTTVARPEQDITSIDFFFGVKKPLESREWPSDAPDHSSLIAQLRKEIRPARPLIDIGKSTVNAIFESYANSQMARVQISCTGPPAKDREDCLMQIFRAVYPKNALDLFESVEERCLCEISTSWQFMATIGGKQRRLDVFIGTREDCGLDSKEATSVASDHNLPQKFGQGASKDDLYHPMFHVHQNLINHIKLSSQEVSRSLCLRLAEKAYQLADNISDGNCLVVVSIRIKLSADAVDFNIIKPINLRTRLTRPQYNQSRQPLAEALAPSTSHRAYIALGSNVGDRITMIESACREMNCQGIHVDRTSALYETEPMYLHDQQRFINAVCEIQTTYEPLDLLDKLKEIETVLGRQKSLENGPRNIDLDILLYDSKSIDHERLSIPHMRMQEREFVLRPLCDLIPDAVPPPSLPPESFRTQLSRLPQSPVPLSPLTPLSPNLPPVLSCSSARATKIMAILNLTPDSFSDGGQHATEPSLLLPTLERFLSAGVSLIDIGGQSTRPQASPITAEEEISRVLPTIKYIRSNPAFDKVAISIDTYRASVADAAISAGANIVNDVSAGQMDSEMLPTIAKLGCTVILMHMRGTPATMTKLTDYPSGLFEEVGSELLKRVSQAERAGIRRWRIILDPGVGFAKTASQNLELLRRLGELRGSTGLHGLPWAVGPSRKQFIGSITGVKEPSERTWGTAVAVTAAIQGGADIVRVHDTVEMAQVAKMADSIWRVNAQ